MIAATIIMTLGGAYLAFCGAAKLATRGQRGGVEIAVPALMAGVAAAALWMSVGCLVLVLQLMDWM